MRRDDAPGRSGGLATVAIRGSGVAATACAHLLRNAGMCVASESTNRPPVPTLMLSEAAVELLRSVFGRPALFADKPRVKRRIIAWGTIAAVVVPHEAVLLSEAELMAELVSPSDTVRCPTSAANYAIFASPPMPDGDLRIFGDRRAAAIPVRLLDRRRGEECWIEAVDGGWLFLVPASPKAGWLMGVGAPIDELLEQSRVVAPLVRVLGTDPVAFTAAPRLFQPLSGSNWLACGTAALGFDPICGDGTAQSVREAILASAVLVELERGGDAEALTTHYRSMLIAAMRRHLALCARFYGSGGQGAWWQAQLEALTEGYNWCTGLLAKMPEPRFALRGFRLVPRLQAT